MKERVFLLGTIIVFSIWLSGCRGNIVDEAMQQTQAAIQRGDFDQASLILYLARLKSGDTEFAALHDQSVQLLEVYRNMSDEDVEAMLSAWARMMLIESESTLIQDEALQLVRERMEGESE